MNEDKPKVDESKDFRPEQPSKKPAKRLMRSQKQRVIAGVCGGLGEYFNIDPVWFRLLFIVFLLGVGTTFVLYLIMWLIMPLEP